MSPPAVDGSPPAVDGSPPAVEVAVGAVALNDETLLLVERGRPPDAGKWSLPGGRVKPGERLAEAVEREVLEETGLAVSCRELVGWVERISAEHHFVIFDFRVEVIDRTGGPVAGDDARRVGWVPLADLGKVELVSGLSDFLSEHGLLPA